MSTFTRLTRVLFPLLVAASLAGAQDLTGTWLKATVTARLAPLDAVVDDGLIGDVSPDLTAKVKSIRQRATMYISFNSEDSPGAYAVEFFTVGPTGLISSCAFGDIVLADGGVIVFSDALLTFTKVDDGEVDATAILEVLFNGKLNVKTDADDNVKKVTMLADGITGKSVADVDGEFVATSGSVRIRAKSVPEGKVPEIDQNATIVK